MPGARSNVRGFCKETPCTIVINGSRLIDMVWTKNVQALRAQGPLGCVCTTCVTKLVAPVSAATIRSTTTCVFVSIYVLSSGFIDSSIGVMRIAYTHTTRGATPVGRPTRFVVLNRRARRQAALIINRMCQLYRGQTLCVNLSYSF